MRAALRGNPLELRFCVPSSEAPLLERLPVLEVMASRGDQAAGANRGETGAQPSGHRERLEALAIVASQAVHRDRGRRVADLDTLAALVGVHRQVVANAPRETVVLRDRARFECGVEEEDGM